MIDGYGWRPIETVPKDRFVLLAIPGSADGEMAPFVALAKWQGRGWYGVDEDGITYAPRDVHSPSHWQPLPRAPIPG